MIQSQGTSQFSVASRGPNLGNQIEVSDTTPHEGLSRATSIGLDSETIPARYRRYSEPDPALMATLRAQKTVSKQDLVMGSRDVAAVVRMPSNKSFDTGIQSFDYATGTGLPKKVRELTKIGPCHLGARIAKRFMDEAQCESVLKWALVLLIAAVLGLTAGGLILSSHHLVHWKLHQMEVWILAGHGGSAFFLWLGYGLFSGLVATLLVTLVEPTAGGSGIPDVKAYLNGNLLPHMLCLRTWVCRVVGLIFVTSSGLFAGTEGPMAHVGAITGAGLSMGRNSWLHCQMRYLARLNNHQTKLEFMSLGASMGVAAAFGAPIGGLLFSLEEASSFWNAQLTWRACLGGCVASLVAKGTKTGFSSIPLQGFIEFPDQDAGWQLWELGPFIFIGISMGLTGALFCACVRRIQEARARIFRLGQKGRVRKVGRICEALTVTAMTMCVTYAIAWAVPCNSGGAVQQLPAGQRRLASPYYTVDGAGDNRLKLWSAHCQDPATEGSGVATILLESRELAIKALFSNDYANGTLEEKHLAGLFVLIFCLTLCTYGSSIPAGLFIPNIMVGGCYGRLVGLLMQRWVDQPVHPGVYALMGATGMLAGFSRMTVSLGVIMLEITSNAHLILPIMLVIMISKLIGDCLTPSAYDIIIALKNIPMLEQEDENIGWRTMAKYPAYVCGTRRRDMEVVYSSLTFRVRDALRILTSSQHNAWPVLEDPETGRLIGLLTRQGLLDCLEARRHITASPKSDSFVINASGSGAAGGPTLDVKPFVDVNPFVVLKRTSLRTAYRIFRTLGLRHLCVVDAHHALVSFITRTDLVEVAEELVHPRVMEMRECAEAFLQEKDDADHVLTSELGEAFPGGTPHDEMDQFDLGSEEGEVGPNGSLPPLQLGRRQQRQNAHRHHENSDSTANSPSARKFAGDPKSPSHSSSFVPQEDGVRPPREEPLVDLLLTPARLPLRLPQCAHEAPAVMVSPKHMRHSVSKDSLARVEPLPPRRSPGASPEVSPRRRGPIEAL